MTGKVKARCCPGQPARKIPRSIHEGARDMARDLSLTDAYLTSRRERKKVEMLFAHLKRILKLDCLRLRGPNGAKDEFLLADIRFFSKGLAEEGTAVQALPKASMALLERSVRGEIVPEEKVRPVLEAAEKLENHLGWEWLAIPYDRGLRRRSTAGGH